MNDTSITFLTLALANIVGTIAGAAFGFVYVLFNSALLLLMVLILLIIELYEDDEK